MIIVNLSRADINYAEKAISNQVIYWAQKKQDSVFEIRNGLLAEYAVVKYLNEELGAIPRISFRQEYIDGRDGGFDFEHHGVKYDVKESKNAIFSKSQIQKTSADVIIATKLVNPEKIILFGYCPVSKLPNAEDVHISSFSSLLDLGRVTRWFNSSMKAYPRQNEPVCTNEMGSFYYYILEKARKKQELKYDESL